MYFYGRQDASLPPRRFCGWKFAWKGIVIELAIGGRTKATTKVVILKRRESLEKQVSACVWTLETQEYDNTGLFLDDSAAIAMTTDSIYRSVVMALYVVVVVVVMDCRHHACRISHVRSFVRTWLVDGLT
jgi:hypothetical protein